MTDVAAPRDTIAHSANDAGHRHPLADHLRAVAALAARFSVPLGMFPTETDHQVASAYVAGLWHDLGKETCLFQDYIYTAEEETAKVHVQRIKKSRPEGVSAKEWEVVNRQDMNRGRSIALKKLGVRYVDHKIVGAALAQRCHSYPVTAAIDGHHGGLSSTSRTKSRLIKASGRDEIGRILDKLPDYLGDAHTKEIFWPWAGLPAEVQEMGIRMLASCLVDADYLDTEAHRDPEAGEKRSTPPLAKLVPLWERFLGTFRSTALLDLERTKYRKHVEEAAAKSPTGMYAMTGDTGIGKTISGMSAALVHAAVHGKERVIVVVPYTTITDQTAGVYRQVFGDRAVVEHHSAVSDLLDGGLNKLASENWDAPIIITTSAQFAESLHSNRPSKLRKLHNIANSVVVIDEPQTLPVELLAPIVRSLQWLTIHAKTTVVLVTATQPNWHRHGLVSEALSALPDWGYASSAPCLKRVAWDVNPNAYSHVNLARQIDRNDQCLCVTNSIRDAKLVYDALVATSGGQDVFFLSTRLHLTHRKATIEEIVRRLKVGEPCRVVSTQLIEAGVDLDFPKVYRVLGPLPSIVQAAGRCNRNAKMAEPGVVHVVQLQDESHPPGSYHDGVETTRVVLNHPQHGGKALDDPSLLDLWYKMFYPPKLDTDRHRLANEIKNYQHLLDFPRVSKLFRLIDDDTEPVYVVQEGTPVRELLDRLRATGKLGVAEWRALARYGVSLRYQQLVKNKKSIVEIKSAPDRILAREWVGGYDQRSGLVLYSESGGDVQW